MLKCLCEFLIRVLIWTNYTFLKICLAQTTALFDGQFSSIFMLYPLLFFIWGHQIFISFSIVLWSSSSHFVSPLPFLQPLSLTSDWIVISSNLLSSSVVSVIVWVCPAVSKCWQWNTCNFDSVNMFGLGRLPHAPDTISDATCKGEIATWPGWCVMHLGYNSGENIPRGTWETGLQQNPTECTKLWPEGFRQHCTRNNKVF